jgi:hypothetical protein
MVPQSLSGFDRVSRQTIFRISVSPRPPIRLWTPALSSGRLHRCSHVQIFAPTVLMTSTAVCYWSLGAGGCPLSLPPDGRGRGSAC